MSGTCGTASQSSVHVTGVLEWQGDRGQEKIRNFPNLVETNQAAQWTLSTGKIKKTKAYEGTSY